MNHIRFSFNGPNNTTIYDFLSFTDVRRLFPVYFNGTDDVVPKWIQMTLGHEMSRYFIIIDVDYFVPRSSETCSASDTKLRLEKELLKIKNSDCKSILFDNTRRTSEGVYISYSGLISTVGCSQDLEMRERLKKSEIYDNIDRRALSICGCRSYHPNDEPKKLAVKFFERKCGISNNKFRPGDDDSIIRMTTECHGRPVSQCDAILTFLSTELAAISTLSLYEQCDEQIGQNSIITNSHLFLSFLDMLKIAPPSNTDIVTISKENSDKWGKTLSVRLRYMLISYRPVYVDMEGNCVFIRDGCIVPFRILYREDKTVLIETISSVKSPKDQCHTNAYISTFIYTSHIREINRCIFEGSKYNILDNRKHIYSIILD